MCECGSPEKKPLANPQEGDLVENSEIPGNFTFTVPRGCLDQVMFTQNAKKILAALGYDKTHDTRTDWQCALPNDPEFPVTIWAIAEHL